MKLTSNLLLSSSKGLLTYIYKMYTFVNSNSIILNFILILKSIALI